MENIVRFFIVGVVTTTIDWTIYWFLSQMMNITIAKIFSMLVASLFSYSLNKVWTFKNSDRRHEKYLWKYYVTFIINIAINTTVNTLIYNNTRTKLFALIVATGCATVINYIMQRFWVFNNTK